MHTGTRKDRHLDHETSPRSSPRQDDPAPTLNRWRAPVMMDLDPCPVCGGDGRILTTASSTSCPACRGSGRRSQDTGFHDVTKTKPSHHHPAGQTKAAKKTSPDTPGGMLLEKEVQATLLSDTQKEKLIQSIIDYENKKGEMTKTFVRLLRKQLRELT